MYLCNIQWSVKPNLFDRDCFPLVLVLGRFCSQGQSYWKGLRSFPSLNSLSVGPVWGCCLARYCVLNCYRLSQGVERSAAVLNGGVLYMYKSVVSSVDMVAAGAQSNAEAAGHGDRVRFVQGDARRLHKVVDSGTIDAIVTNPPWGVRIAKVDDVDDLYRGM